MEIDLNIIKEKYPVASHLYGQYVLIHGLGCTFYQFFDEHEIYPWVLPEYIRNSDKVEFKYGVGKIWYGQSNTRDKAEGFLFNRCFDMLERKLKGTADEKAVIIIKKIKE